VEDAGSPGGYAHVGERIPPNWFSRETPYTLVDLATQLVEMYRA